MTRRIHFRLPVLLSQQQQQQQQQHQHQQQQQQQQQQEQQHQQQLLLFLFLSVFYIFAWVNFVLNRIDSELPKHRKPRIRLSLALFI